MLVLTRKHGERIRIALGDEVVIVTVVETAPNKVRLGFDADKTVKIDREEVAIRLGKMLPAGPVAIEGVS